MNVSDLDAEHRETVYRGAAAIERIDVAAYYAVVKELLAQCTGPLSHRAIADIVQAAQRPFNRAIGHAQPSRL
jgi:hypothetical protein